MISGLGKSITVLAFCHFVVNTNQDIPFIDDLILMDHNFLEDATFEVLNHLNLLGRDHLSRSTGHLVQHGKVRPESQDNQQQSNRQGEDISH